MKATFGQRLDNLARSLSPFATTMLLLIVGVVPLHIPHMVSVVSGFALISVYYWAVHRPTVLPLPAVFVVGLFSDLLSGGPLGVGVLVLLLAYGITVSQRRDFLNAPFILVWWGFALVAAGAAVAAWLLNCFMAGTFIDPQPAIVEYLLNLGLYPGVAYLFARAQRSVFRRA